MHLEESKQCDDEVAVRLEAAPDNAPAAALFQRRLAQTRRCLQVALALPLAGTGFIFLLWYTSRCADPYRDRSLARHAMDRDDTELRISYMLCCPGPYVVGVVGYGGGAALALIALAIHAREASKAATASLGRTCAGCCWRTRRDGRLFFSFDAGAVALAFVFVALAGLFLLAVFPVRPCSQRASPGRGWPHSMGSLLFFFSGDGLLGTLLFACDGDGAYGFMRGPVALKAASLLALVASIVAAFAGAPGLASQGLAVLTIWLACIAFERELARGGAALRDGPAADGDAPIDQDGSSPALSTRDI